jgi:hypothetical protein
MWSEAHREHKLLLEMRGSNVQQGIRSGRHHYRRPQNSSKGDGRGFQDCWTRNRKCPQRRSDQSLQSGRPLLPALRQKEPPWCRVLLLLWWKDPIYSVESAANLGAEPPLAWFQLGKGLPSPIVGSGSFNTDGSHDGSLSVKNTPRRFSKRSQGRTEMKALECPRCHSHVRLDQYRDHIAKCTGPEPATAATPQATAAEEQLPQPSHSP